MKNQKSFRTLIPLLTLVLAALACRAGGNQNVPAPAGNPTPVGQATPTGVTPPLDPGQDEPDESAPAPLEFVTGRNDYTITVDDTPREFLVYIPGGYDASQPTPVVFMFHGSNQGGPLMYETTAWAAQAEADNLIIVYPTGWKYPLLDESGLHTKWNSAKLVNEVMPGTELKDDVKFVRTMLDLLKATFNVDAGRIFATGFSNGGGFVLTRLMIEMNNVFAAFAVSGSGLFGETDLSVIPTGLSPDLYIVLGTNDDKISEGTGHPLPFPVGEAAITADPLFQNLFANATTLLSLSPGHSTVEESGNFTTFTFSESLIGADNVFIFRMVEGMFHVYANGDKVPKGFNVSELFWAFFEERAGGG